jgi:hypothetical protein
LAVPSSHFIPPGYELPLWERPPGLVQEILLDLLRRGPGLSAMKISLLCTLIHGECRIQDSVGREHFLEDLLELSSLLQETGIEIVIYLRLKRKDPILSPDQRETLRALISLAHRARRRGGGMRG